MATIINLTAAGSSTTIDDAIFVDSANIGSGTGNYNTFFAILNPALAIGNEQGFNSDDTAPLDPSNQDMDPSKTHTVLLSTVPVTIVNGVEYYEFRVDLNESTAIPTARSRLTSSGSTRRQTAPSKTQRRSSRKGNLVYNMAGGRRCLAPIERSVDRQRHRRLRGSRSRG